MSTTRPSISKLELNLASMVKLQWRPNWIRQANSPCTIQQRNQMTGQWLLISHQLQAITSQRTPKTIASHLPRWSQVKPKAVVAWPSRVRHQRITRSLTLTRAPCLRSTSNCSSISSTGQLSSTLSSWSRVAIVSLNPRRPHNRTCPSSNQVRPAKLLFISLMISTAWNLRTKSRVWYYKRRKRSTRGWNMNNQN